MITPYEVRTLGSPGDLHALSRHRLFKAACRACVAFIERGLDAHVYLARTDRRVEHRFARTPEGVRCVLFPDPDTQEFFTVAYRGRRGRP